MGEKERNGNKRNLRLLFLAGCVSTAFFCLLHLLVKPLFVINDDVMIESVLSGSYLRPYPYTYYFSAELGLIISGLYFILPAIPWLGLFYAGCHVACMTSILRFLMARTEKKKNALIAGAFVMLFMIAICFQEFVLMHYTVLAALLGATGLFLFVMAKDHGEVLRPIIYFQLCYLVRENVFFMLMPFIVLAFLWQVLKTGVGRWKEWIPKGLVFMILTLAFFTLNRWAMTGKDWKEYLEYNEVRTSIYDYLGYHSEEEALREYEKEGVTKRDVEIIKSYDLALFSDGSGNLKALNAVAAYGEKMKQKPLERLNWSVKTYLHRFLFQMNDFPFNLIAILAYLGLAAWFILRRKYSCLITLAGLACYRSAFWIYLFYKGRYPDRVIDSLYYMELAFLAALLIREVFEDEKGSVRKTLFCAAAILLTCSAFFQVGEVRKLYRQQSALNREGDLLISYMQERRDKFYFIDVYALVGRTKKVFEPTGTTRENYLWMGGWMTRHPLYLEKLRDEFNGADNASEPLLNGEAYLVLKEGSSASVESMEEWLGATLTSVDEIAGEGVRYVIYQVEK